jgi:hypothetical protein
MIQEKKGPGPHFLLNWTAKTMCISECFMPGYDMKGTGSPFSERVLRILKK